MIQMRQERLQRRWTLEQVAQNVGISLSAIQKIELGQRNPSYDVLVKLLDLFGYSDPRELFAETREAKV